MAADALLIQEPRHRQPWFIILYYFISLILPALGDDYPEVYYRSRTGYLIDDKTSVVYLMTWY